MGGECFLLTVHQFSDLEHSKQAPGTIGFEAKQLKKTDICVAFQRYAAQISNMYRFREWGIMYLCKLEKQMGGQGSPPLEYWRRSLVKSPVFL